MTTVRRIGLPVVAGTALIALLAGCSGSAQSHEDTHGSASPTASASSSPPSPSESPSASSSASVPAVTTTLVATPEAGFNAADIAFAQMMIPHHLQAIDMATLAQTRATDMWVRDIAAEIEAAQDPQIRTLKSWLSDWGKEPMPRGHEMPGMLSEAEIAKLSKAKGSAFDRMFVTMMIEHHEGAIQMAEEEQAKGVFADAKTMAESIATTQRAEVKDLKKYLAKLK